MAYMMFKKCKMCGKSFEGFDDSNEPVPTEFCEGCVCGESWLTDTSGHQCNLQKGHEGKWHKCSCGKRRMVRDLSE